VLSSEATAALVVRAKGGDADAFSSLVRAYLRAAYAVALGIVGRQADADDVAQDAFVLAFERLESCREPARFGGWLLTIVRNQAKNFIQRRNLRDVTKTGDVPDLAALSPLPDARVESEALMQALMTLSEMRREIVLLHDLDSWTHGEIAQALDISEVSSRQYLFQARRELRAALSLGEDDHDG
jgi:RNA polymerase sigma-70 factor (ECF subfamily)